MARATLGHVIGDNVSARIRHAVTAIAHADRKCKLYAADVARRRDSIGCKRFRRYLRRRFNSRDGKNIGGLDQARALESKAAKGAENGER